MLVAVGMPRVPVPSTLDDALEVRMFRNPAEILPDMLKGDYGRRMAQPVGERTSRAILQTVAPTGLPSLLPRRNFICPHLEGSEVVFTKRRRERHVCCVASARH